MITKGVASDVKKSVHTGWTGTMASVDFQLLAGFEGVPDRPAAACML
jgi:hypothetical protein